MSIYDFKVKSQDGGEVSLADYRGKVLLIVNTAAIKDVKAKVKEVL